MTVSCDKFHERGKIKRCGNRKDRRNDFSGTWLFFLEKLELMRNVALGGTLSVLFTSVHLAAGIMPCTQIVVA